MSSVPIQALPFDPFYLELRTDGVGVIWIDASGPVNVLRSGFGQALDDVLDRALDEDCKGALLVSGKADFVLGTDLLEILSLRLHEEAVGLSQEAHRSMDRLAAMEIPVVAAVAGACLGTGLELALACDAIVAAEAGATRFGLPEVQLGLIPAAGGTERLPARVGLLSALDLLTTGRAVPAREALRMRLVDELVPRSMLIRAAAERSLALASGRKSRHSFRLGRLPERMLSSNPMGRRLIIDQTRKRLSRGADANHPAIDKLLDVLTVVIAGDRVRAQHAEAQAFGRLATSAAARQLIRAFVFDEEAKRALARQASQPELQGLKAGVTEARGSGSSDHGAPSRAAHERGR